MLLALLLLAAAAQPPKTLAVLQFHSSLSKDEVSVDYLTDVVRTEAKDYVPSLKVMTRENLLVLLQATGKKMEECEGECEVDTGRRVGADYVVSGEVLKFGTQFKVSMRLHETHDGELLSGAQATGKDLDSLDRDLHAAVRKLFKPLLAQARPQPEVQKQPAQQPEGSAGVLGPPAQQPAAQPGPVASQPQTPEPAAPAPRSFSPHPGAGFFGTLGFYEPTTGSSSGDQSFVYGVSGYGVFRFSSDLGVGAFGDYDNFNFDNAPDVAGYDLGAVLRFGDETAIYGGIGYSHLENLGGGVGLVGGVDFEVARPFTLRLELSYRTFSTTTTVAAVSTETSGSILAIKGGLGVTF